MTSYALKGFLSRCNEGKLVRTVGSPIAYSILNLSTLESSDLLIEKKLSNNVIFEKNFEEIARIIKTAFCGGSTSYGLKPFSQQNSIVAQLFEKFVSKTDGSNVKIIWVENHSTLVELVENNIPAFIRPLIHQNSENQATFFVDISFFINGDAGLKVVIENGFMISLLYRLSFLRGVSKMFNFSDKESFHITLSLLDGEVGKYYNLTRDNSNAASLRGLIINFLDINGSALQLDHDKSLVHCLKEFEESCERLPAHVYFNNVFELEKLLLTETDKNLRNEIKTCLFKRDKQIIVLIKQMDVSLPYPRQEFQKSYQHFDLKTRRELCFQLIKNFDRSLESLNIGSVVSRLRNSAKYSINQPKLVVGRESRAFGNQAYLFANSKLIDVDDQMIKNANGLTNLCTSDSLKQIINEQFEKKKEKLNLNHELNEILAQFFLKFDSFLFELVPSIGRLISLVFNESKSSSFTQYNGVFQNLREALEIFLRKSSAEVEKQRKKFLEDSFESSTRSNGIRLSLSGQDEHSNSRLFFLSILKALTIFSGKSGAVETLIQKIENSVYSLYSLSTGSVRGAYSVLLQRPSFAGSERFKLNELETKPEQEEALQKLVTIGGDHLYMSPSYEWIAEATDLIEAVPLFIYERTVIVNDKPSTVFEVDQEGLEQTIRQIAEFWAQNIDLTIESEHISLARSIMVRLNPDLKELSIKIEHHQDTIDDKAKRYPLNKEICDLIALESLIENRSISRHDLSIKIAKLSEVIASYYNDLCVQVENKVEKLWSSKDFVTRIEAFERVLIEGGLIQAKLLEDASKLPESGETKRLAQRAFDRQRPLPAFHLLTTEAPGLVEGFITVVLEEEMAMRNVIKSFGLDDQVKTLSSGVQKKLAIVAEKAIEEFGYEPIVFQNISNGLSKENALLRVMSENIPIEEQVSKLSILLQMYYYENNLESTSNISLPFVKVDHETLVSVENYWLSKIQVDVDEIKREAQKQVIEKNKTDYDFNDALEKYVSHLSDKQQINDHIVLQFLINDPVYSKEALATQKWIIRSKSFEHICDKYPDLHLQQRAKSFIREHTSLIQTTCRRHVISKNDLHSQLCHPKYAYSSGVTFDDNKYYTSSSPSGLRKRYHLIYAPSRVNLGKDERKSVENWSQFLGVSDSLAARHAQNAYEMINYSPVIRNIREAENLKVSENQWTALVRSVRNVHAFFVERLGVGDIEDLSYQFNQRGGINLGSLKEGEGYNSGPTAGYCIPKDLLFKLFVGTHQDSRKLLQIGVPTFLHQHLKDLMIEVYSHKNKFSTIGEWELWAANEFLNKESLSKRFAENSSSDENEMAHQISNYLQNFITLSGSKIIFHLTKLIQILGNTGVPSPLLSAGRDLHSVLWSNWSDHKITLGGEQVNRATVFTLTREIPESAKRSRLMNPKAGIVQEDALRIVMNGVYKGDDDEPPPPDVRYSWTMRAFQIMSGHYQAVADSLDLEGQVIARLSWVGFKPESDDPKDIEATEYLTKKFNEDNKEISLSVLREIIKDSSLVNSNISKLVERLKKAFPCHTTVGDITVTAVHGVDSEDLLGFSAETLTLLGDEADKAKQILETHGHMSYDQMRANAVLRRKFPEEWSPLNQLPSSEQQHIKEMVGGSYHPLVLRLRGPGTNFISDLQGQDVVVFSITHPEILKLDPSHLRDLMIVGRPNSALCVLDYVAQGRHRCWFERDVMLWYAAARGLTVKGQLSLDWNKRNLIGRHSVYKAFGTGIEQYSPSLGTDLRSEVVRQEKRAIEIWNAAKSILNSKSDKFSESIGNYQNILTHHLSSHLLSTEALFYQQCSQKLLMSKRFKTRDKIIQESTQKLSTTPKHRLAREFTAVDWISIGGIFLINGTPKAYQTEILDVIREAGKIVKSKSTGDHINEGLTNEAELIAKLIVPQLQPTRMTLGEKKGEMFSVKASEDSQSRAVTRRAQLSIQADLQLSMKHRAKGFEIVKKSELDLTQIVNHARRVIIDLSNTPESGYSVEFVNEKFGLITKYTLIALEIITNKFISSSNALSKEDSNLKENIINSINKLYNNGSIDLKVLDSFCGTYEDHGFLARLLEYSRQNEYLKESQSTQEILSICELLYSLLALEKTSQFLTTRYSQDTSANLWRKLSEFFAKTIDDHFYEYNPWILDSKRGSSFVHYYNDLGIIKEEYKTILYSTSWLHHRILYRYFYNLIINHSDIVIKVPLESDRNLLIGSVTIGENQDGSDDTVKITSIGNSGVGKDYTADKNYESLWRSYNQLREISFMRNDGFEFPVVFSSFDSAFADGLNSNQKINLAILSPVGRTHYSRAIMESSGLNDNVFITRTGFFSDNGKTSSSVISREKTFLFIEDAHFFLDENQYHSSLKNHYGMNDQEASNQILIDKNLGRFSGKGIRVAATFKQAVLIGCCIAHHHHPLEIGLTEAGYPATDKSPFLFDLTYNKSLYPVMYASPTTTDSSKPNKDIVLLPPQIDWFRDETVSHLEEQTKRIGKSHQKAEDHIIELIKERLRPFALEHGIIIAKGSAESGARNLNRFDIRNLGINTESSVKHSSDLIDENVLLEAAKFIYQVSKGQNVTIQRAIVSTPLSWMSQYAVKKFLERQIVEHSVSVNIEKYPKDFIYGTLRVIFSSAVPDINDLSNPSNWTASHLISLSSLQMATNVGRQGTLEILSSEMIHAKFRDTFIEKLSEAGKKAMSLTSTFGPTYWNEEINLYGSGNSKTGDDQQKILPYKLRNPGLSEKDASGIPYWWPRYLMLDLIPEALFIDKEGKEIAGAHIIDIITTQSSDGSDQSIYLVRDRNGKVCEGKIYDFLFWLLEPNVGIGLWPNYWKREVVRCQDRGSKTIDFQEVGISDRIVLQNFLKAGNDFMKVKSQTNHLINKENSAKRINESRSTEAKIEQEKSITNILYETLSYLSLNYGLILIGKNQVSLWLSEALKTQVSQTKEPLEIFECSLKLLKSITHQDISYCIQNSNDKTLSKNKASLIPSIKVKSNDVMNWLSNESYAKRICETMIDSLMSQPLAPLLEVSPESLSFNSTQSSINLSTLLNNPETFAIISDKTSLLTHQIYPFICGKGDYPVNIVAVHSSWIISNSNLAKRAVIYNPNSHSFIEGDLEKPLILDYGFIVELCIDGEVKRHEQLTKEYEPTGLKIINYANLSRERADDKLWIRNNVSNGVLVPKHIVLSKQDFESNSIKKIDEFLQLVKNGVVLQPSANTTESSHVDWLPSSIDRNLALSKAKSIYEALNVSENESTSVLVSEFRGNVNYKGSAIVLRFNVSDSQISAAAYVAGSVDSKIVGLKGTRKNTHLQGYCERLDVVLNNLYEESTEEKIVVTCQNWNSLLQTAHQVAQNVGLPLVGIDMLIEHSAGKINGVVLEVNARPGTLIFGEELIFDETGSFWTHSLMVSPVNEDFWNSITQLSSKSAQNKQPQTLLQWKLYMSSEYVLNWHPSNEVTNDQTLSWLLRRYGSSDSSLIKDRIFCLNKTIDDCIMNENFDLSKNVSIIFSNGRDRYFGGHTDLLGLGGPTINGTSENEIIAIIQETEADSFIHVSNSNPEFKTADFSIEGILAVLDSNKNDTWGKEIWNPNEWTSYLKGSLAFMLSTNFSRQEKVIHSLFKNKSWTGCRMHFNSSGRLELLSKVGSSSSAALTSSFVLGLNKIFEMGLNRLELSETDFGEYYLGKTAGCADKTTILNAKKGKLIAQSSIPDRFIQSLSLPKQLVVIMANSNIPRMNSLNGRKYLSNLKDSTGQNLYSTEKIDSIINWFNGIMRRFGSFVFIYSVELIIKSLINEEVYRNVGITKQESIAVLKSFGLDENGALISENSKNKSSLGSSKSLLRELCFGGNFEKNLSSHSGWLNRYKRYNLIFRLLKLLPESVGVSIAGHDETIHPRKTALYGISEVERCHGYLALVNKLNDTSDSKYVDKLLNFVRWAHDGDRAVQDYRKDFSPTPWATDKRNLVSDNILDLWISNEREEITDKPGGFERSLPEFDEWATSLDEKFHKQAALRVSAAGIGGSMCVHALNSVANDVILWLKNEGFSVRTIHPGPSFDIF